MPSFLGRIAAHRLASSAAATSSSRVVLTKHLGRLSCPPQSSLTLLRAGFFRSYATPGRPKKADTGSSTQSVSRARKTAAAAAPKATKKTTTKKKAATTKATTKKKVAKATKSTKSKKTASASKKKELTQAQKDRQLRAKEKKVKAKEIQQKRELKEKALFTEPKTLPATSWTVFLARQTAGKEAVGGVSKMMSKLADDFKAVSQSEKEDMARQAEANKLQNAAAYKAWVESHTPEQIAEAQQARNLLRRKFNFPKSNGKHKIQDDRQPKAPSNAYIFFHRARRGSGDFANVQAVDALKQVANEWKSLTSVDRQPFEELAAADLARYKKEIKTTLHRDVAAPKS